MEKMDIIQFFDRCASWWDDDMIRNEDVIARILDNGGIKPGVHVLDVACGTGVLFPDYLKRGATVTGIDISPEMVKVAQSKFPELQVICGDVEAVEFDQSFDCIMAYNAFPHFPEPAQLIQHLAKLLKPGGILSIAHGMSRAALLDHHAGRASKVSIDLLEAGDLAGLLKPYFEVDVIISDRNMYQVTGIRRDGTLHSHGGHSHTHSHDHDHSHAGTPMEELLALMKYMVSHNDAHAQELAGLADQLRQAGKDRAYRKLMDAVADFDMANAQLEGIFKDLSLEE
jgi:demethylmenaquinone methyltransferase/2-methoxy-6-polyprenyl-1,4-benzoquinol methylase